MTGRTTSRPLSRQFKRPRQAVSGTGGRTSLRFLHERESPWLPETGIPCSPYTIWAPSWEQGASAPCLLWKKTGEKSSPFIALRGTVPLRRPGDLRSQVAAETDFPGIMAFSGVPPPYQPPEIFPAPVFSASGSYRNRPAWYTSVAVRNPSRVNPPNCAKANHQVPASRLATVTVPMQGSAIRQNIMMLMPWRGV